MKFFAFLGVAVALIVGRADAATAYEALKIVKQQKGDAILSQLVEVCGDSGQPQPQSWKILMRDSAARAGIREFVVTGREITSERTPLRSGAAPDQLRPLNFTRLNLDSDGAFRLANEQATKQRIGFNRVDYFLQTNPDDGAPVWTMQLFDHMGAPVGSLEVSAENAKVVRALRLDPDARERPVAAGPPPPQPGPDPRRAPAASAGSEEEEITTYFPGGVFGFTERTAKKVGRAVTRGTLNAAGFVQEVFTGERTIGDRSPADSN